MTHFAATPIAYFRYDRAMRVCLDPEIGPSLPTARSLVAIYYGLYLCDSCGQTSRAVVAFNMA